MSFTFSQSSPSTGALCVYTLISTLTTAGWTKVMDSDGTTYSASGVQVTSGATGTNGLDNTSAWVRLQAPAVNQGTVLNQTREITIQRGANTQSYRIKYSASAGFTGGSPGNTQTPSAADEVVMIGAGTDASPTYFTWFNVLTNGSSPANWYVACGGAAEFYGFVAFGMRLVSGTVTPTNMLFLDPMAPGSYSIGDVDPAVIFCSGAGATAGNFIGITSTLATNPVLARAWLGATSSSGNNVTVLIAPYGQTGSVLNIGANPFTGNDDLLPGLWMRQALLPCGVKGFSTLFMLGTVARNNMTILDYSKAGAKDKVYVNSTWMPWSGTNVLL